MVSSLFSPAAADAIEHELDAYFKDATERAAALDSSYQSVWEALYGLMQAGGKRFRPNMTMLAYDAFGGRDTQSVIPIAAAQELLHLCLLIHDDIIDRDYIRHGVPNIAGRYKVYYQRHLPSSEDITHYAHSTATLAGDLMLSGAFELLLKSSVSAEQKITVHRLLSEAVFVVAGGELMDTEASFIPSSDGNSLKVALYKTAHYSFVTPLVTGAYLAGADDAQIQALRHYAEALGVAYQLVDDLLGVFGAEKQTGKSSLADIREGRRTYLVEQALAHMNSNDKMLFNLAFGNQQATTEAMITAKELLVSTGARQHTEALIDTYRAEAHGAIAELQLGEVQQEKFTRLIDLVTKRSS